MKKKTTYNGDQFTVDSKTLEIQLRGQTLQKWLNQQQNRNYVSYKGSDGKNHLVTRARIICQAFHPNENYQQLQTDHIDSDQSNDIPSNLRWVTRKENNSTQHSKMMRSLHAKSHQHRDEIIEAVNEDTGEVKHFANGKQCAESIGCSSPAVYMALDRSKTGKKATIKKWILKWTKDVNEDELKNIKRNRKLITRTLRLGKLDRQIERIKEYIKNIDKSISKRESRIKIMKEGSARRKTAENFIDHLKQKKKSFEIEIEELNALKLQMNQQSNIK